MMQVVFQLFVGFGISNLKGRNLALNLCFDATVLSDLMSLKTIQFYNPGNRKASNTITLKTSPPVSIKHDTRLNNLLF